MEEKPLECSQCRKKASIVYQEVVDSVTTTYHMCSECPILKQKLEGKKEKPSQGLHVKGEELCCSHCHTTLDSVLLGHPLGCIKCYQVFQDVLAEQLTAAHQIAPNIKPSQKSKSSSFHVGKSPETETSEQSSTRLSALNEALNDALNGENYEQAAWLRDQINSLMEKTDDRR